MCKVNIVMGFNCESILPEEDKVAIVAGHYDHDLIRDVCASKLGISLPLARQYLEMYFIADIHPDFVGTVDLHEVLLVAKDSQIGKLPKGIFELPREIRQNKDFDIISWVSLV